MIFKVFRIIYNRLVGKIPKNLEFKDLKHFYPDIKRGRVIKVYDGDSITIAARVPKLKGRTIYKFNIRLNRIDTPEIKSKNNTEKAYGLRIRDYLNERIMNKMVNVKIINTDKYGRYLAEIYYKKENINTWLLNKHYAIEYDGGRKKTFSEVQYNINLTNNSGLSKVKATAINLDLPVYDEGNEGYYTIT